MKIWKLFTLSYITLSSASFAQSQNNIELALSELGGCLNEISTKNLESGKSKAVYSTALLTSVYKNMGYEAGSIKEVDDKYIKLYRLANEHCSKQIVAVKKFIKEKS